MPGTSGDGCAGTLGFKRQRILVVKGLEEIFLVEFRIIYSDGGEYMHRTLSYAFEDSVHPFFFAYSCKTGSFFPFFLFLLKVKLFYLKSFPSIRICIIKRVHLNNIVKRKMLNIKICGGEK